MLQSYDRGEAAGRGVGVADEARADSLTRTGESGLGAGIRKGEP